MSIRVSVSEATSFPAPTISACILARNEEGKIGDAFQSLLGWTDQIIVLDNESTDATVAVARRFADLVVPVVSPGIGVNFDALRNIAIEHATGDWIFYLDADERVPAALGLRLKQLVAQRGDEFEALLIPFKHYFCGRWMQHCGWWPGYTRPQLLKKGRFKYNEQLHMGVEVEGTTWKFPADDPNLAIVHFSYDSIHHYLDKLNRYTDGEAENLIAEGGNHSWKAQIAHFVHDWQVYYDRGRGYEDGMHGFVLSLLSAFYRFASRAKLWDLRRQRGELVNPTETVPASLREVVEFMEEVLRDGAGPWLRSNTNPSTKTLRLVPSSWFRAAGADVAREPDLVDIDPDLGNATRRDDGLQSATPVSGSGSDRAGNTSPISVCIVAHNEEAVLEDALRSVAGWARRVIFVDNGSTDATAEIARRYTDHLISVPDVQGHLEAVRYMVREQIEELAFGDGCEWLLFLDADERVPAQLADALRRLCAERGDDFDVLFLPFRFFFCGKWMEHCGYWPGYKASPQLVRKGAYPLNPHVHWGGDVKPGGRKLYLPADSADYAITHLSVRDLHQSLAKENRSTTQEVPLRVAQGTDGDWRAQIANFAMEWQDAYETTRGDLDGMHGFVLAFMRGMSRFFMRAKLWEYRSQRETSDDDLPRSVAEIIAFIGKVHRDGADRYLEQERVRKSAATTRPVNSASGGKGNPNVPIGPLVWSSPLADASGYASEARQFVLGLAESGFPVALAPTAWGDDASGLTPAIETLIAERSVAETVPTEIFVSHTLPPLVRPSASARINVARTMFETDRLPAPWVSRVARMDRIWVPSAFNRDTFVASGVPAEKIAVIPAAVDPQFLLESDPATPGTLLALPGEEPFRFLSVFDWTLHKGWDVLLEAFARSFGDNPEVGLVLKVWSSNGHTPEGIRAQADAHLERMVGKGLSELPNIHLWTERLAEDKIPQLYRSVQAYVTPTRGEGWCRPLMEAMAMGLPCIATDWSGLTEFFGEAVGYPLRFTLTEVSDAGAAELPSYAGHRWAEPDVAHLSQLLRRIVRYPAAARRKGALARERIATSFSRHAVTETLWQELKLCHGMAESRVAQASNNEASAPPRQERSRAVLFQSASGGQTALLDISERWHGAYARQHGMEFICHKAAVQTERAANWDKIAILRHLLHTSDFEHLIWLDADTLIVDFDRDLRDALPASAWLGMVRHHAPGNPDGSQWFNSGALYVRNTPLSRAFFDEVWRSWPAEHFWEDNMAIIRVLGFDPERWGVGGVQVIPDDWNSTRLVNESAHPAVMAWHGSGSTAERARLMGNVLTALDRIERARQGEPMTAPEADHVLAILAGMGHSRARSPKGPAPVRLPANPLPVDTPTLRTQRSTIPPSPTNAARDPITVRWEGDFSSHSSLSLVNRELCLQLTDWSASAALDALRIQMPELSAQPPAALAALLKHDPRLTRLIESQSADETASLEAAEVTFRHFFPPDWRRPEKGKLVVMQPWEYGHLPQSWVEASRNADQIWAYSRFVRDVYVRSGVPAEKVHLIPLGVRKDVFRPEGTTYPLPTRKRCRFLFVGGTIHRKGADLLLEAWKRAFRREDDVCLIIKDMGTETYYRGQNLAAAFRAMETDRSAAEVCYLGDPEMDTDLLASLYRACTAVVLPYRAEGFALSPLEGMACGLCPIVTAGGPTDDYLDDSMALRIPSYRDPSPTNNIGPFECVGNPWTLRPDMDALVAALRWVYEHPEEAAERGQAARGHVEKGWTWERSAAIAGQKLRDIVEDAGNAPARVSTPFAPVGSDGQAIASQPSPSSIRGKDKGASRKSARSRTSDAKIELSLCIIARDEEPRIGKCLDSIRPWVDEMIVVDTGSTDRTREIAVEAGARVFDFPWTESFAEARNQSLSLARGEWVFWMDADDVISEDSGALLREIIRQHPNRDAAFQAQVRIPAGPGEFSESLVDHVKLFPNRPDLRFEHRIHEQILPALRRAKIPVRFSDLYVTHRHYDRSQEGQTKKRHRDFRLLELDLRDRPNHPFVLFNLGMTHLFATKDYEVAAHYLQRCLMGSDWRDSIVRKAYALLTTARSCQQDWAQAIQANEQGRQHYPDDPELLFQAGQIYQQVGRFDVARTALERLIATGTKANTEAVAHYRSVDAGLQTCRGRLELALLYRRMGDGPHCVEVIRQILRDNPGYEPARMELAQTLEMMRHRP